MVKNFYLYFLNSKSLDNKWIFLMVGKILKCLCYNLIYSSLFISYYQWFFFSVFFFLFVFKKRYKIKLASNMKTSYTDRKNMLLQLPILSYKFPEYYIIWFLPVKLKHYSIASLLQHWLYQNISKWLIYVCCKTAAVKKSLPWKHDTF